MARYPEVLNRVWLQLMCCALLINLVPNFGARSKVGTRLKIRARLVQAYNKRVHIRKTETKKEIVRPSQGSNTLFRDSLSHNRIRATPATSNIKGQVIKAICNIKGQWWSRSMGNARRWP